MDTVRIATAARPPAGGMKGRAPPPPQPAPRRILTVTQSCRVKHDDQNPGDMKENVLPGTVDILVVLPNGAEKKVEVSGSKAVMDLLIDLCSQYHLNPAHHTLELQSRETRKPLGFKPNTPVGVLDIDKVLIKQKVIVEKPRRPPPVVPEKTVRLVVNFLRTQKTVVRVSPLVPLQDLLPVICEKCDFSSDHLVLLKDSIKREKVDLSKSLNDLETRELYALDTSRELSQSALTITGTNEKEEKGLLGFFKIGKKKTKGYSTAPSTPTVNARSAMNPSLSASNVSRMSQITDVKKRRAPPPPSTPPEHISLKSVDQSAQETGAESLNSTQKKRHAPPPPPPVQNKLEGTEFDRSNTFAGLGSEQGSGAGDDIMEIESGDGEETASVKSSDSFHQSCSEYTPASEDELLNADDSGTASSHSDIPSPVSLTGSLRLRHTTDSDEILSASNKVRGTEEYSTWSSDRPSTENEANSAGNYNTRFETGTSTGSDWKEEDEISITAQVQLTLAGLDAELAAMQEELAFKKSSTLSDRTNKNCVPDEQETVPVTVIDEVSWTCHEEIEEKILLEKVPSPTDVKRLHDVDRCGQTNSKTTTGAFLTNIHEQSRSNVSFDTFYPASVVTCIDIQKDPIKKTIENLQGEINNVQDEMKPVESKLKMVLPATELKYDLQVRGNDRKEVHNTAPAEVDPAVLEARNCVEILRNSQAEHLRQDEKCSAATCAPEHKRTSDRWLNTANKITNECVPKVGMRTFTVIPPKPVVKPQRKEGLSPTTGAIKIDDQGNLIHTKISEGKNKETAADSSASDKESLVGRAMAFWNVKSTDKDNLQCANPATTMAINTTGCTAGRLLLQEPAKQLINMSSKSEAVTAQTTAVSSKSLKTYLQSAEGKPFVSVMPLNVKIASIPANTNPKTESNFIRPFRRTSSQYVASAICRYTDVQSNKIGAANEFNAPCNTGFESKSEEKHKFRPAEEKSSLKPSQKNYIGSQVNTEFALHSNCNTENVGKVNNHKNVLLPEAKAVPNQNWLIKDVLNQTSSFNKVTSQTQLSQLIIKEAFFTDEQCPTAKSQIPQSALHSSVVKDVTSRSPNDQSINTLAPASTSDSVKIRSTATRQSDCISHHLSTSNLPAMSTTASSVTETAFAEQSEPSSSYHTNCFNIKPNTNMFGPVKKFKPIIQKPVQKDECIHSSLMEAIQSGQNKQRLRKTSDTVINGNLKKSSFTATENEHSALLTSIRAHSGISELRKTTSTISKELQDTRNAESSAPTREYSQIRQPTTPSSIVLPPAPPPPPDFPKTERFTTKSVANSEDTRTALLEAIRSGTGAARLRKVSVPSNTLQINGRTSSVQTSCCWTPYIPS
ncbi:protein cordon-bleu isoform X8 [Heptranchias perlo]|uniref:protein cordon-bleu isoform X8 n=1 Tax=Heptranchias perlo TaxID=212740 RepID=UPI0035598CCE